MRYGEMTAFEERPHSPYYGCADATPLFVVLLDEYERWTGDRKLVRELEHEARAALHWIDEYADLQGNGYVAYERRNEETGLENQCWKDSWDSISYRDGTAARLPARDLRAAGLRLRRQGARRPPGARGLEATRRSPTELEQRGGRPQAPLQPRLLGRGRRVLRARARRRRQPGRLARPRTSATCCGAASSTSRRPKAVARHLMGPRLFSGWGVRTLAEGEGALQPDRLPRRHRLAVRQLVHRVGPAPLRLQGRGGRSRRGHPRGRRRSSTAACPRRSAATRGAMTKYPVQYPTACSPQAWSTGAPLLLLRTMLGLEPIGDHLVVDPALPSEHRPARAARHPRPLGPDRRLRARARRRREAHTPAREAQLGAMSADAGEQLHDDGRCDENGTKRQPADVLVDLRDHGRPGEGDDVPIALPARAARAARLPDRRRRRRRLDASTSSSSAHATRSWAPASSSTRRCSTASRPGSPTCRATSRTPATYDRVARRRSRARRRPVFYLEIPPFLFGTVVKGLPEAGLTKTARVVVEKPFGHDLASARALADELHQYIDESQLYRIDHYLGKMGLEEILYLRFANTMLEPVWNRNYVECVADHDGRGLRRRGPWALLRPGRRAARRRRQPPHAGRRGGGDGAARRWRPRDAQGRHQSRSSARSSRPTRAHYVRGQYDGYLGDRRRRAGLDDRDVCGAAPRHRELALVGRAVLHPHGQAPARRRRPSSDSSSSTRPGSASALRRAGPNPTSS